MTLHVFTARISTRDPDRLDITRKSGGPAGLPFAPSWAILRPALQARTEARKLMREAAHLESLPETMARESGYDYMHRAERLEDDAWNTYVLAYFAEMRVSYGMKPGAPGWGTKEEMAARRGVKANRPAWDALLARGRVCLTCYCADPEHCHRTLLGHDILPTLGAVYCGELSAVAAASTGVPR